MKLTKTQIKNAKQLYEYVRLTIECDTCGRILEGGDEFDLAEDAAIEGWKVNKYGHVKCGKCK